VSKRPSSLALTLSGGGFRATLFHLGAIRFLYEANLLKDVGCICSASGGSVLAAHVVLNWDRYLKWDKQGPNETGFDKDGYDAMSRDIVDFAKMDIRGKIVRRLILRACGVSLGMIVAVVSVLAFTLPVTSDYFESIKPWPWMGLGALLLFGVWWMRTWVSRGRTWLLQAYYEKLYNSRLLKDLGGKILDPGAASSLPPRLYLLTTSPT
jgi:Patatin-like phospholipase